LTTDQGTEFPGTGKRNGGEEALRTGNASRRSARIAWPTGKPVARLVNKIRSARPRHTGLNSSRAPRSESCCPMSDRKSPCAGGGSSSPTLQAFRPNPLVDLDRRVPPSCRAERSSPGGRSRSPDRARQAFVPTSGRTHRGGSRPPAPQTTLAKLPQTTVRTAIVELDQSCVGADFGAGPSSRPPNRDSDDQEDKSDGEEE
jgi:hypothetical protein